MISGSDNSKNILKNIKIPPAPFIISQLHEQLQKDEPSLSDIAEIISQDLGISALVIRTVNSAFYGLNRKVNSIKQATGLLGIINVVNIVAGLALQKAFEDSGAENPPNYWDSPVNIAMITASLANNFKLAAKDEAYSLGLFHNAGHALLMQRFSDYALFLKDNINDKDLLITELEDQRYNTNHAVMGYYLAKSWGLDSQTAALIRDHHDVVNLLNDKNCSPEKGMLISVLKMAEHIDKLFWSITPDYEWESIQDTVLDYAGISEIDFSDLCEDMLEKLMVEEG